MWNHTKCSYFLLLWYFFSLSPAKLKKVAQKKPEFLFKPKPINKGSNKKTMTFEVITDGNPEPLYNWYFNDEEVRSNVVSIIFSFPISFTNERYFVIVISCIWWWIFVALCGYSFPLNILVLISCCKLFSLISFPWHFFISFPPRRAL